MAPVGYDIDMATLIAEKLGVKLELVPGDQRQPHPLPADQEGRPGHLQPGQEPRAREGDRLHRPPTRRSSRRVRRRRRRGQQGSRTSSGKTVGVTRGAIEDLELTKVAPAGRDHQALRGQQRHDLGLPVRPGRRDRVGQRRGRGDPRAATRPSGPRSSCCSRTRPAIIGLDKDEPTLLAKVNEIIATAKTDGSLNAIAQKWLGPTCRPISDPTRSLPRCTTPSISARSRPISADPAQGHAPSRSSSSPSVPCSAWRWASPAPGPRTQGPAWLQPVVAHLCGADPQHAVHRSSCSSSSSACRRWACSCRRDDGGDAGDGDQSRRLRCRDRPRRHPGDAAGPDRGRRQPGA